MYQINYEPVQFLIGRKSTSGAGQVLVQVDACISDGPEYRNKISSYPVENGLDVTDHIYQESDELKIEGVITNTPDNSYDPNNEEGDYVFNAHDALMQIVGRYNMQKTNPPSDTEEYPNPVLVDIIGTRNRVYTDMICESLSIPATKETGDALTFTASFKKVRMVSTSEGTITYNVPGGSDQFTGESAKGKVVPAVLTDAQALAAAQAERDAAINQLLYGG